MRLLLILAALLFTLNLHAAISTWDGGSLVDNNWSTAANWVGDVVPNSGDDLVFSGSTRTSPTNDFAAGTSFNSISFSNGASSFNLSGNAILISGGSSAITASNASNTMTIAINLTFTSAAPTITSTSGGTLTISGTIDNGGYDITIASGGTTTLSGIISGSGGVIISGTGNMTLSGANTYSGNVTVGASSKLFVGHNTALGNTTGTTSLTAGASPNFTEIYINSGITVTGETLTLNTNSTGNSRSYLRHSSGTSTWNGTLNLAGNGVASIFASGTSFTVAGTIAGSGLSSFSIRGSGTGILTAVCSLSSIVVSKVDAGIWTISSTGNVWGRLLLPLVH